MTNFLNRLFSVGRSASTEPVAIALAEMFSRHVSIVQSGNSRLVKRAFELSLARATAEKRKHGWGAASGAVLCNQFQWQLIDRGYPKQIAHDVARDLAVALSRKPLKKLESR